MPLVADVLYAGVDGEVRGDEGGVGRLLRFAACGGPMLADVVELDVTAGVRPQPPLRPVEPGAVLVPARQVPEGHRHLQSRNSQAHFHFGRILLA